MRVVWSPLALRQVARIFDYLAEFNPRAAEKVSISVIAAGDSLADFASRGRPIGRDDLRELVAADPYIIRYRIEGDVVQILRVRHAARKPD